ncbi:MAG TPA: enoyl-CoA hydratase [Burkholderiaceae bacterium]|nr:enoyl-CoA hydratase [Burkholderiaceae bacterium]
MATPEAAQSPLLLVDRQDGVVTLTLNRPDQYNALSTELLDALHDALTTLDQDLDVRCVVIAGSGRAFCAGHDLKQMRANPDRAYYLDLFTRCGRVMQDIVNLPVPVIAKVHGTATAAGCQLVASCDLAIAADTARFAVSGINVGLFCSTPAVALTRTMPIKKAFEMLVTGEFIDAHDAVANGLINHAVPADQLDARVQQLVDTIVAKSPVAVRTGKAMYKRQATMALYEAYEFASDVMAGNMMSEDAGEGIDAFIQKRKPTWTGR